MIENIDEYLDGFSKDVVVKQVLGKGRGLFSARSFEPGDIILSEKAVLVSDYKIESGNPLQKLVDLVLQVCRLLLVYLCNYNNLIRIGSFRAF